EPGQLDLREQRPAELDAGGRAVRPAAMRLRLRRLRAPEGRPAGARHPRGPADVPARVPELRQLRVAAPEPHGADAGRPRRSSLVRGAPAEEPRTDAVPARNLRAR